jgi:hypothetical protein
MFPSNGFVLEIAAANTQKCLNYFTSLLGIGYWNQNRKEKMKYSLRL